jgi:hypothetical protein
LINTIIDDTYKIGKENAKFAGEIFDKGKRFNVDKVDPAFIQNNLIQRFTTSPEALRAISSNYVRIFGKKPTDQDLTNYIMDEYKTKHSFDYVGEAKDLEKSKESTDSEKTESVYSNYINKAVAGDTKALKQLEALGGGNYTLTVSPRGDKFLRITPNKKIKYSSDSGASVEFETDGKSIDINKDANKLFKYLQKYGVRPSGSKAVSKLGDKTSSSKFDVNEYLKNKGITK